MKCAALLEYANIICYDVLIQTVAGQTRSMLQLPNATIVYDKWAILYHFVD